MSFPDNVEPGRHEWFLQGTEWQAPADRLARGLARIRVPVSGEVVALDPDIPPAHQRIVFAGDDTSAGQRWLLNRQVVGPATVLLRWESVPGQYTLSVVDHQGRTLDTVSFEVRPGLTTVDSPPSQ